MYESLCNNYRYMSHAPTPGLFMVFAARVLQECSWLHRHVLMPMDRGKPLKSMSRPRDRIRHAQPGRLAGRIAASDSCFPWAFTDVLNEISLWDVGLNVGVVAKHAVDACRHHSLMALDSVIAEF